MLLYQLGDVNRMSLLGKIEGSESVTGQNVGICAFLQKELRQFAAVELRGPMERCALGNVPLIETIVDRWRIFTKSRLHVLSQVEANRIV